MVFNTPSSQKKVIGIKADLKGWDYVCTFGTCLVYAKGGERRLINAETGEVIFEYIIGIHEEKFEHGGNKD